MIITNLFGKKAEEIIAHNGEGNILFRRVLSKELSSKINFIDYTIMPPNTKIGYHQHIGTEEVYVIISGSGLISINGIEQRVNVNDVIVASDGDWHGLENDTDANLVILVFEGNIG